MIKILIIDDDRCFADILQEMLKEQFSALHWNAEITVTDDPISCLNNPEVFDIYFLDISMPQLNGIELVQKLREKYIDKEFVFVSAYDEYIRKSIYVKPRAFIRKMWLKEDLEEAVLVLKTVFSKRETEITIKDNFKDIRIKPWNIIYLQSSGHYVEIYDVSGNRIVVRNRIQNLEEQLKKFDFVRVHSRYLINLHYLSDYYSRTVILQNGRSFPISKPYLKKVNELIMNWIINRENAGES